MTIAGILLIVIGFVVRIVAMLTLRKNWSVELRLPDRIVTWGIYRYIRHPSYSGSLLVLAGLLCVSQVAAIGYLGFLFFVERIVEEEKILCLYPEYRDYRNRTWAIIPRVKLW